MSPETLATPPTDIEVAGVLRCSPIHSACMIRRLAFQRDALKSQLAIAEKRIKTCERLAEPYTSATGSRWWELQFQGETFLKAVDAAGRDTP